MVRRCPVKDPECHGMNLMFSRDAQTAIMQVTYAASVTGVQPLIIDSFFTARGSKVAKDPLGITGAPIGAGFELLPMA